jgi:Amt family ammonium transporter
VSSFFMGAFTYPIFANWAWGGGWLAGLGTNYGLGKGYMDFAGSGVVHSVGGLTALAMGILIGPRIGKYTRDGKPNAMPGHDITMVLLGCFILAFGWFGFNPGSTMAMNPPAIAHIAVTTNSAAAAAALSATAVSALMLGKPDLSMILNGALAGLVAITASCAYVNVPSSMVIGVAAGGIVVLAVLMFDKLRIDDPVGALSVHLVNGVFGTLALGLFADKAAAAAIGTDSPLLRNGLFFGGGASQLGTQALGVLAVGAFTFGAALLVWFLIKATLGIRVPREEEMRGLDIGEHGMEAYAGFQIFTSM